MLEGSRSDSESVSRKRDFTAEEQEAAAGEGGKGVEFARGGGLPRDGGRAPLERSGLAVHQRHVIVEGVGARPEPA